MNANLTNPKILPAPYGEEVKEGNTHVPQTMTTMPAGFSCVIKEDPTDDYHQLMDPKALQWGHQAWKSWLIGLWIYSIENDIPLACPACGFVMDENYKQNYLPSVGISDYEPGQIILKRLSDPNYQFCPIKKWRKPIKVGEVDKKLPRRVLWPVGHSFCAVCNEKYHGDVPWSKAKSCFRIWDDRKTISCNHCRNIIQVSIWSNKLTSNGKINWSVCEFNFKTDHTTSIKTGLISPTFLLLCYLFLPFILAGFLSFLSWKYVTKLALKCKWFKANEEQDEEAQRRNRRQQKDDPLFDSMESYNGWMKVWCYCFSVLFIATFVFFLSFVIILLLSPIFYILLIRFHLRQRRDVKSLKMLKIFMY